MFIRTEPLEWCCVFVVQEFLQFLVDAAHEEVMKLRKELGLDVEQNHTHAADDEEEWSQVRRRRAVMVVVVRCSLKCLHIHTP
jgi:hypothetical protein